ncbi:MAG: serine hydrolase [Cytophagales bacterium]|nr:serine hydrolase [Cytophagales bacterium]
MIKITRASARLLAGRALVLGVAATVSFAASAQPPRVAPAPASLASRADSIFAGWNKPGTPGGAVAVLRDGEVVLQKAYGLADVGRNVPNTPATPFNVASIAKQFTAACVVLLAESGKLSLDDDIRKYFPEFALTDKVTVRHLLTHTSGLREAYVLAVLAGKINLKGQARRSTQNTAYLVSLMSRQRDLNFKPGEEFAYTNVNYVLLGEIVRRVSGQSLRRFADSSIFRPLGMTGTFFDDDRSAPTTGRAVGYQAKGKDGSRLKKTRVADGGVVGDHNLITTLEDLVRWDRNFDRNALGRRDPALVRALQTRYVLNNGDTIRYGLGLELRSHRGHDWVGHGGDDTRYTSFMVRFPREKLSVICLSNTSRYGDTQGNAFATADLLLGAPAAPAGTQAATPQPVPFDSLGFAPHAGGYMGGGPKNRYGYRQVFVRDGKPYLWFRPGESKKAFELVPSTGNRYFFKVDEPDVYVEAWFAADAATGEVQLHEKFKGDTITFRKKPSAQVSPRALKAYAGKYGSDETGGRLKVKTRQGNLVLVFFGIIKVPTIPVGDDSFYAPDNAALVHFDRDGQGGVTHLRIDAADFRNVKFTKR